MWGGGRHVRGGGQAQVSALTFLCLRRIWLTSDPHPHPVRRRETQSSCSGDTVYVPPALSSAQVVDFHHSETFAANDAEKSPPSKDNGHFSSQTRGHIFPLRRQSSLLNFRQDITLSRAKKKRPPPTTTTLRPPPTSPSVCLHGDGSF